MRLLVCGSRNWSSEAEIDRLYDELWALAPTLVMHGGAKVADAAAESWTQAQTPEVPAVGFIANWHRDGLAAGPIRNARMLRDGKPDRGIAFGALWRWIRPTSGILADVWKLTGTGDMVRRMLDARLPVKWIATHDAVAIDLTEMPEPPM